MTSISLSNKIGRTTDSERYSGKKIALSFILVYLSRKSLACHIKKIDKSKHTECLRCARQIIIIVTVTWDSARRWSASLKRTLTPLGIKLEFPYDDLWLSAPIFDSINDWRRLDEVFQGQYLPSFSIDYEAISWDLEKLPPQLY